jgi:PA domain
MRHDRFVPIGLIVGLVISSFALAPMPAAAQATIVINNVDDPGQGFNDQTPASAVGKNRGKTIGAQRLNVFQKAAEIWGDTLASDVTIVIQATFQDRGFTPCTATGAVLGAAGTIQIFANFPNREWPATWYHSALANKLAGFDLTPSPPDPGFLVPPFADDIIAFFNPNLGKPGCLLGSPWYYGLDNKAPAGTNDLLNVVLHELGHGLGFANFVADDGSLADAGPGVPGLPDIYTVFTHDNTARKQWNQMTDAERGASTVNTTNVVWNGPTVTSAAPGVLGPRLVVTVDSPSGLTLPGDVQAASFGPPVPSAGLTGDVSFDSGNALGCNPFTPGSLVGRIALIDRGTCLFTVKVKNAQDAGAIAAMVANNQPTGPAPMGGADATINIPSVGITQQAGAVLKANLPASVTIGVDTTKLAGTDDQNHVRLYAPNPVAPGSSISHWDTVATPNLLMEPFLNDDLKGATTLDLTPDQMTDIGWSGGPHCPVNADARPHVIIGTCDSGVSNRFGPFTVFPSNGVNGGCHLADLVGSCAGNPASHGQFVSCVTSTLGELVKQAVITPAESDAIKACAEAAPIP